MPERPGIQDAAAAPASTSSPESGSRCCRTGAFRDGPDPDFRRRLATPGPECSGLAAGARIERVSTPPSSRLPRREPPGPGGEFGNPASLPLESRESRLGAGCDLRGSRRLRVNTGQTKTRRDPRLNRLS